MVYKFNGHLREQSPALFGEQEEIWPRRAYFEPFARLALQTSVKRAVVLIGPRRIGKTVMLKLLASGSAAAALRMKSRESGAGRFTEFIFPPLSFAEYLQFAGVEASLITDRPDGPAQCDGFHAPDIEGLNAEFVNYLNFGGFPEAVMNPAVCANPARFLRQDIADKVLLKDLPSLYGIGDTQELNRFFNVLAFKTGNEVSLEELGKHAGITKARLADYLEYLEAAST